MLTASLQSTWETQRHRQAARPKYLQSSPYGDESDNDKSNNHNRGYGNTRDLSGGSTDLPNLRVPSVRQCDSICPLLNIFYDFFFSH